MQSSATTTISVYSYGNTYYLLQRFSIDRLLIELIKVDRPDVNNLSRTSMRSNDLLPGLHATVPPREPKSVQNQNIT